MGPHVSLQFKFEPTFIVWILLLFIVVCYSQGASAHRPIFSGTRATDPSSAVRISDPTISHVIYSELTAEAPHRWLVFYNDGPQEVAFQAGLPEGIRQQVDPIIILFGPGLPALTYELPVMSPIANNGGAIVMSGTDDPNLFDEPITGTKSWIVFETDVSLPSSGTYYGVVYNDNDTEGKVWVSVGRSEGFGWRDILRLPGWIRDVRRFHEVPGAPRWVWIGLGLITLTVIGVVQVIRRSRA